MSIAQQATTSISIYAMSEVRDADGDFKRSYTLSMTANIVWLPDPIPAVPITQGQQRQQRFAHIITDQSSVAAALVPYGTGVLCNAVKYQVYRTPEDAGGQGKAFCIGVCELMTEDAFTVES
jgi:hypothetical protein